MRPFLYPEERHLRAQTPPSFTDYRQYKPYLRLEFAGQCVYCRMPDGLAGADSFGVDHYRPTSRFPDLGSVYGNLFYSCNRCNRRKGDFWPTDSQWSEGAVFPNPCDHRMSEHLRYRGARVQAISRAGEIAVELLMLNDEEDVRYREFVRRSIERCLSEAAIKSELLLALTPRLLESQGTENEQMRIEISRLKADLSRIAEDFERLTGARLPGSVRS